MPIDPLLPNTPPRRVLPGPDSGRDALAQLLAVAIVIGGVFATIGVGELMARGFGRLAEIEITEPKVGIETVQQQASGGMSGAVDSTAVPAAVKRYAPRYCDWLLPVMEKHGLPAWMSAVAHRESRCQTQVHNGDRSTGDDSYGLFQINTLGDLWQEVRTRCAVERRQDLLDAETNIACAASLYQAYGYRPWDRGRYFN